MDAILASVLTLALGLVFLLSAFPKLQNLRRFTMVVMEYNVLPARAERTVGQTLPFLELLCAGFLLSGFMTRAASMLAVLLLVGFAYGVTVNLVRARNIECGCFGGRGGRLGVQTLLLDLVLLAGALLLFLTAPSHNWALVWDQDLSRIPNSLTVIGAGVLTVLLVGHFAGGRHQRLKGLFWKY